MMADMFEIANVELQMNQDLERIRPFLIISNQSLAHTISLRMKWFEIPKTFET